MKLYYDVNLDNVAKFEICDDDDLFIFYQLLTLGCELSTDTTRKIKTTAKTGTNIIQKLKVTIRLKVERIEYGTEIAVTGLITKANNSKVPIGKYHTHRVAIGSVVTLWKSEWSRLDRNRLHEACDEKNKSSLVIVGIDGGNAKMWYVSNTFIKEKESVEVSIPKRKRIGTKTENQQDKFYGKIYTMIENNVNFDTIEALIVAGNFSERNTLIKSLKDNAKRRGKERMIKEFDSVVQVSATNGLYNCVRDVLSDPNLSNRLDHCKSVKDMTQYNKFMDNMMKKENAVGIGYKQVMKARDMGALQEVFLCDEFMRICEVQQRIEINKMIEQTKHSKYTVRVLGLKTEAGCEIMRLGGIVCILKYEVDLDEDEGEFCEDYDSEDVDWFGANGPRALGSVIEFEEE